MESALLHVWSDALGSGAVIVGGLVMAFTAYYWVDAVIGLALSLWILRWSWRVILDSAHVLLESTPKHIETEKVISELRLLDDRIQSVDDLHVWEITSRMYSATAEVQVFEMDLQEADRLRLKMHDILYEKFGIAHVVLAIRPK
jgi:cobalt-zinc-cadmium efflux system protein